MKSGEKPSVLLIIVDSLRADHLSCNGYSRRTTPHLDDLATQSIVFDNAVSASGWTRPSYSSIFTGTYPSKNGDGLDPRRFPTIMQVLHQHGYKTFGITNNSFVEPLCVGFDILRYLTRREVFKMMHSREFTEALKFFTYTMTHKSLMNFQSYPTDFLKNKIAKRWLSANFDKGPFFMYLDYSVHWPYDPPEPSFRRYLHDCTSGEIDSVRRDIYDLISSEVTAKQTEILTSLYDGNVNYIDDCLKELTERLESLGILDDMLLIVTADHGELLGEHGLFEHHFVLYEPLIRVPLILRFPDANRGGTRHAGLVQTLDILPTLIDYLNIDSPEVSREIQGKSLLEFLDGKEERKFTISERSDWAGQSNREKMIYLKTEYPHYDWEKYAHKTVALRTKEHKYIWSSEGRHELFDLKGDPGENRNLISSERERGNELRSKLDEWRSSFVPAVPPVEKQDFDPAVKKRLRALGYLD